MQILGSNLSSQDKKGDSGQWNTVLPPAMSLTYVSVPSGATLINPYTENAGQSSGYNVRFMWGNGAVTLAPDGNCCGGMDYAAPVTGPIAGGFFIVQVACNGVSAANPGCEFPANGSAIAVAVNNLTLTAADATPPAITAPAAAGGGTNLASASHFVRGTFELTFTASNGAASGVCSASAAIDGTQLPTVVSNQPNLTVWQQCPASASWSQTVNTAAYPNGPLSIVMNAGDAASPVNTGSWTVDLVADNAPVTLSLSGATDNVSSSSDTAQVTATASAGPSGVAGISCTVDHGASTYYKGSSATINVSGYGAHHVDCVASNNSLDANGRPAQSPTESFDLLIRRPTEAAITFGSKIIHTLLCRRANVTAHGHTRRVRRCHARTVRRRERVIEHRHGHTITVTKVVHVVVLPRTVQLSRLRVRHGKRATVSGVLLAGGAPLAGQAITVLAAPDNGLGQYTPVTTATTTAGGTWSARLPAGPSRLVEASYGGTSTTAPTAAGPVKLTVPARIHITISPRTIPWHGAITIRGHLDGGYVPADGVALRLLIAVSHRARPYQPVPFRTNAAGGFTIPWSWGSGSGVAIMPIAVATTANESDYPFSASRSRWIRVTFGRRTPGKKTHHRHKRHRRQRRRR